MRDKTLCVELSELERDLLLDDENPGTRIPGFNEVPISGPLDLEQGFLSNYAAIERLVSSYTSQGVLAIVVDRRGVIAHAHLAVRPDGIRSAVFGRHQFADVRLSATELSLRHLMLVTHPLAPAMPGARADDIRFQLVDLRTNTAFVSETGEKLATLEAEAPVFVNVGNLGLYLFPTGPRRDFWPDDPQDGWACIPPRVYFGEQEAREDWPREAASATGQFELDEDDRVHIPAYLRNVSEVDADARTQVHVTRSHVSSDAIFDNQLLAAGEDPRGFLKMVCEGRELVLSVGESALRRGLLLGRYPRCDGADEAFFRTREISRVHVLLMAIAGEVWAVDTGSSNGLRKHGQLVKRIRLAYGDTFTLGDGTASLPTWEAVN